MRTLLITGIAGDIGQGMARIVRETYPSWRLLGMDLHLRHAGLTFVDDVLVAPPVWAPDYEQWLTETLDRCRVDWCLPTSEAELGYLVGSSLVAAQPSRFVIPNRRSVETGLDKYLTALCLAEHRIPGPWTVLADDTTGAPELPCIFKVRRSAGSKGVFVCRRPDDAAYYRSAYGDGIFQELLLPDDQEVTVALYRDRKGAIAILQLLRKLAGGMTAWAKVIRDPAVTRQCTTLALALDLHGAINVQLRLTEVGPRIFEVNARFSSTLLMRHRMGFRDAIWALEEAQGHDVMFHAPPVGTVAVRVQDAMVLG